MGFITGFVMGTSVMANAALLLAAADLQSQVVKLNRKLTKKRRATEYNDFTKDAKNCDCSKYNKSERIDDLLFFENQMIDVDLETILKNPKDLDGYLSKTIGQIDAITDANPKVGFKFTWGEDKLASIFVSFDETNMGKHVDELAQTSRDFCSYMVSQTLEPDSAETPQNESESPTAESNPDYVERPIK